MKREPAVNPGRLKRLLREMVDLYSPSGKEEDIVEWLAGYLHERGLPVTLREVTDGRRNIEVVFAETPPELAFIGHIDTIPAFDIDDYGSREQNGVLHGLGTADMKSGCAAMIEAFIALTESGGIPERAGLFLVVGEEETGDGTTALLNARSFPWAIVAEPTGLTPCLAHYGYIEMLVRVFGTRRHAAQAGRSYNAIMSMLRMLLKLAARIETDHPEAILNIRDIHSSESGFVVPGSCEAGIDLHLLPDTPPRDLVMFLKQLVEANLDVGTVTDSSVEFPIQAGGYRLEPKGRLPKCLRSVFNACGRDWNPGAFPSHSDANLLHAAGCSPIILGPGQLAKAHTRDESVVLAEVTAAADLYLALLRCW